jgi:hypothetical protein
MTITPEQLATLKAQAERLTDSAGDHCMKSGQYTFTGQTMRDAALSIEHLIAEVARLREAMREIQEHLRADDDTGAYLIAQASE